MKILGVIAEFNPFHNGHKALLEEGATLGYTHKVVVLSGNFVQRAQPAHTHKWVRTHSALLCGADLVLELPVAYATASAREFGRGAVEILQATGCVEGLLFGSEGGGIQPLLELAELLQSPLFNAHLKEQLAQGLTYAVARQKSVETLAPLLGATLAQPNNLLGLAYIQAAQNAGWTPEFHTLRRQGVAHHSPEPQGRFASASALRKLDTHWSQLEPYIPAPPLGLYKEAARNGAFPVDYSAFETALLSYLRRLTVKEVGQLADISEGIEHRLVSAFGQSTSLTELYALIKTKRYPLSRVRRWVLSAFLGLDQALLAAPPPYLRVLGFTPKGRQVLGRMKSTATLPFDTQLKRLQGHSSSCARLGAKEALATDLYSLLLPTPLPSGLDYTHAGVIVK